MVETHFFHYHLPLSSQISDMETFGYGFLSCTSPPLLLFHANNSNLLLTCLGLHFWVWISISGFGSIFGFGSLFVFGFVCQTSREHLTKTHERCHHWWSSISPFLYSFFFPPSFGLVLCLFGSWSICGLGFLMWYKDLMIFYLGFKGGLGMVIYKFVDIFDLGFVSKWL